jgi:hypothetical protein
MHRQYGKIPDLVSGILLKVTQPTPAISMHFLIQRPPPINPSFRRLAAAPNMQIYFRMNPTN